ncbi:Predicted DNA-binding transcriptional regulator YafY, contains an HTH and WYL domains [Anaerovirgula multivorans]|uniref:Predicted DNA-binding transcriptional regulator YafY, contains an HTH and WYL domains n=1 Tax=Anaerovirgula multivorans TaxID=312168 RepID=A0A239D7Q5_9FIRM|nr:YafY family protein [Anaerovirgula multivorans]SNS27603.1 Predicted DNA-binding transcriptional regulator YafY, contains an HTH and WYL domains [Anaerovirgula multivorans]
MKLDRLMSILVILLRKERVQAKELAEMFDVSVRTILRDVDTLNLAGIPIVTYRGSKGGIGIVEGYRLDRSILTDEEMTTIITALRSLATTISDPKHEVLMEKFKNTLSASQYSLMNFKINQFIVDLSPWGGGDELKLKTDILHQAIEKCREVVFTYNDSKGVSTDRRIEPYSLVLKTQKWYLYGWCFKREAFRLFKLSRMREIEILDRVFIPKEVSLEQLPWESQWKQPDNMIQLQLIFEKEMKSIVEEWFGAEAIILDDERLMISATLPENNWLYGFILSFGTAVEVISPPHIRRILGEIAEGIQKKYF